MISMLEQGKDTKEKWGNLECEYVKFNTSVEKLEVVSSNIELACKGVGIEDSYY